MLQATIFQGFISISVTSQVYDIASEIFPNREIQSGYDMRDFLTKVLPDHLLNQVKMDPESGAFYATFILNTPDKIEEVDIRNVKLWMNAVQGEISLKYISTIQDRLSKITPEVVYASTEFVTITRFQSLPIHLTKLEIWTTEPQCRQSTDSSRREASNPRGITSGAYRVQPSSTSEIPTLSNTSHSTSVKPSERWE